MASKLPKDKLSAANTMQTLFNETQLEAESRKEAKFPDIEATMPKRFSRTDVSVMDKASSMHSPSNSHCILTDSNLRRSPRLQEPF
jgi:hypothetical protein